MFRQGKTSSCSKQAFWKQNDNRTNVGSRNADLAAELPIDVRGRLLRKFFGGVAKLSFILFWDVLIPEKEVKNNNNNEILFGGVIFEP